MSYARWSLLAGLLMVAASCGGGASTHRSLPPPAKAPPAPSLPRCRVDTPAARRRLPRLRVDVAAIRRARTHAATSAATDRFIAALERSGLSLATENRVIDLAISASLGKCADCFQALEALRPIPALGAHQCR